jgi:hypothetical protein
LGKAMTGLPIDFQIQQQSLANKAYEGRRSSIGFIPLRMKEYLKEPATIEEASEQD